MNEQLKSAIEKAVAEHRVFVFMKGTPEWPQCGFSKAVCDVFKAIDAPFAAANVLENLDAYRATLGEITQWPTIPQVFINGEFVGGCDILVEMYHSGELHQTLGLPAPEPQETTAG